MLPGHVRKKSRSTLSVVMAGLVPAISTRIARCFPYRDRRDKPGDDIQSSREALQENALLSPLALS